MFDVLVLILKVRSTTDIVTSLHHPMPTIYWIYTLK